MVWREMIKLIKVQHVFALTTVGFAFFIGLKIGMDLQTKNNIKLNIDKINKKGEYLPFYGYTSVAVCKRTTQLDALEDFIKTSSLRNYLAALPASSYHMTLFNIWNFRDYVSDPPFILPPIEKWMSENGIKRISTNYWLPKEALHDELSTAQKYAKQILPEMKVRMTLRKPRTSASVTEIMGEGTRERVMEYRDKCSEIFGHKDEILISEKLGFHINFAYKKGDIRHASRSDKSAYDRDYATLQSMVDNLGPIELEQGDVHIFTNMTKFIPYSLNLI